MENFVNNQVDIADLPRWESVIFQRVAGSYKYVIILNYMLLALVFVFVALFIISVSDVASIPQTMLSSAVGIFLFVGLLCSFHLWSYMRWGYALRQKDLLYRTGIFTRRVEIVPYKHIQHVQIKEGILARAFSLVSIEVYTAGSGKSIQVLGIPREDSAQIQEFISTRISTIPAE